MSDSLRSLRGNVCESLIRLFLGKKRAITRKSDERIPSPVYIVQYLDILISFICVISICLIFIFNCCFYFKKCYSTYLGRLPFTVSKKKTYSSVKKETTVQQGGSIFCTLNFKVVYSMHNLMVCQINLQMLFFSIFYKFPKRGHL